MHEFGVTERIVHIALDRAALQEGERIQRLQIVLDPAAGYVPDSIRFYFEQLAQGTPAEGATLDFQLRAEPRRVALASVEIAEAEPAEPIQEGSRSHSHPAGPSPVARWHLAVQGAVQGVGFRPFVHTLATELGLVGWVRNTSDGVKMELQGPEAELHHFLHHLRHDAPPLARIAAVQQSAVALSAQPEAGLAILPSQQQAGRTLILPDAATCDRCVQEIFDAGDRRCGYAFTNCTHCGPRYTIVTELPYDRRQTTMASFPLCPECAAEYADPTDRRFHAQPVACPECGPRLWYVDVAGLLQRPGPSATALRSSLPVDPALAAAVAALQQGQIVAVKGIGGFHLACLATDAQVVARLRRVKARPYQPLALMVRSVAEARRYCQIDPAEEALLLSAEAPIVLLRKSAQIDETDLAPEIAPHNGYIGVMLPYSPLHHLLLQAVASPLVMTSGNRQGDPLCIDNAAAWKQLRSLCDGLLLHDRPIASRCDDSVLFVLPVDPPPRHPPAAEKGPQIQPMRRSRGLAPLPLLLPESAPAARPLLATGGDLKNVCGLAVGRQLFLTPHLGDLDNPEVRQVQAETVARFERLFRVAPEVVACDLHPNYASSCAARARAHAAGLDLVEIQHHHAHIAACLVDNGRSEPVIGLAFDGTGYGLDGQIWGGEALWADLYTAQRSAHLELLPLPGGDGAIRHPDRTAAAYLQVLLPHEDRGALLPGLSEQELALIDAMVTRRLHTPQTSSMGRLFDAVSALLGLCTTATYEGQAAVALEAAALAGRHGGRAYAFDFTGDQIRLAALLDQIVCDRRRGRSIAEIACSFHCTVAEMAAAAAQRVQAEWDLGTVALSGGVWQNRLLLGLAQQRLIDAGFEVLIHRQVPANDGGLALGQAAIAAAQTGPGR